MDDHSAFLLTLLCCVVLANFIWFARRVIPGMMFERCLRQARKGGYDQEFILRFNTKASLGDSLKEVIEKWGVGGILKLHAEVSREHKG